MSGGRVSTTNQHREVIDMRTVWGMGLALGLGLAAVGCGGSGKEFAGPKIDKFTGRLVHNGKTVNFPEGEQVVVTLFHEKGESFGVPVKADGSWEIGWMPIGKYSALLKRDKPVAAKTAPSMYSIPGGLSVEGGKTEYTVELGKNWKP